MIEPRCPVEENDRSSLLGLRQPSLAGPLSLFLEYAGDPAATAYDCIGKHYREIAAEQFRNQTLQKQRMNSGWRYQYIAKDCAVRSRRFITVSDIGAISQALDWSPRTSLTEGLRSLDGWLDARFGRAAAPLHLQEAHA